MTISGKRLYSRVAELGFSQSFSGNVVLRESKLTELIIWYKGVTTCTVDSGKSYQICIFYQKKKKKEKHLWTI